MLTLRLTQKLAASLHVTLVRDGASATNAAADWCCHRFTVARSRFLLITNASTFYSVVLRARGLGNVSGFTSGVIAGLRDHLFAAGHELAYAQLIEPQCSEVCFVPVADRRALGVMNDFIFMAKAYLGDLSPRETSNRLNECPVRPLGGRFPCDVFPSFAPWSTDEKATLGPR